MIVISHSDMKLKLFIKNFKQSVDFFGSAEDQREMHNKAYGYMTHVIKYNGLIPIKIFGKGYYLELASVNQDDEGVKILSYYFKGV